MNKIRKSLKLGNNLFLLIIANLSFPLFQYLLVIYLTKSGRIDVLGEFSYIIYIVSPIFVLTDLNLKSFILVKQNDNYSISEYLQIRLISNLVSLIIIFIILPTIEISIWLSILLLSIAKFFDGLSLVTIAYSQYKNQYLEIALSQFGKGVLYISIFIVLVSYTESLEISLIGYTLIYIIFFLVVDLKRINVSISMIFSNFKSNFTKIRAIFYSALPMGFSSFIFAYMYNIPGFYIKSSMNLYTLGVYSSILALIGGITLIGNPISEFTIPKIKKSLNSSSSIDYVKLFVFYTVLSFGLSFFIYICFQKLKNYIIPIMLSAEFLKYSEAISLSLLIIPLALLNQFLFYSLIAINRIRYYLIVVIIMILSQLFLFSFYEIKDLNQIFIIILICYSSLVFTMSLIVLLRNRDNLKKLNLE